MKTQDERPKPSPIWAILYAHRDVSANELLRRIAALGLPEVSK